MPHDPLFSTSTSRLLCEPKASGIVTRASSWTLERWTRFRAEDALEGPIVAGRQAAIEIQPGGRPESAVAADAVAVQYRLDVAEEAHGPVAPGRRRQDRGFAELAVGKVRVAWAGPRPAISWQPTQARVSPGWKLMNDRIRRSSIWFSSSSWK